MDDGCHVAKKILDELFATHSDHRLLALGAEKLVRDLDKLWVGIKEGPPTLFAVVAGLVYHVEQMVAHAQPDVTHREVFASQRTKQTLRYDWRVSVLVWPKFFRNSLVSLGRGVWVRCWCFGFHGFEIRPAVSVFDTRLGKVRRC